MPKYAAQALARQTGRVLLNFQVLLNEFGAKGRWPPTQAVPLLPPGCAARREGLGKSLAGLGGGTALAPTFNRRSCELARIRTHSPEWTGFLLRRERPARETQTADIPAFRETGFPFKTGATGHWDPGEAFNASGTDDPLRAWKGHYP